MARFRTAFALFIFSLAAPFGMAFADGGKIWIYPYSWNGAQLQRAKSATHGSMKTLPKLPPYVINEISETPATERLMAHAGVDYTQNPPLGLDPRAMLPRPNNRVLDHNQALVRTQGGNESDDWVVGHIVQSFQRVIIAWNGYSDGRGRQTLIVDPGEYIECEFDAPMLNVVPLPGRPISVEPVEPWVFDKLRNNLYTKLGFGSLVEERFGKTIGPHNIFVWELNSVEEFQQNVQRYVAEKFGGRGAALVTKDTVRTIEYYLEKGFRYFAFDLSIARKSCDGVQYRTPIAYTCVASHAFLPLVTTNYGGSETYKSFNLIVLTPDTIKINGAINRTPPDAENRDLTSEEAKLVGGRNVRIPISELREISPKLVEVFAGAGGSVAVRNFQFSGNPAGFNKDFTAISDR